VDPNVVKCAQRTTFGGTELPSFAAIFYAFFVALIALLIFMFFTNIDALKNNISKGAGIANRRRPILLSPLK